MLCYIPNDNVGLIGTNSISHDVILRLESSFEVRRNPAT